MNPVFFLMYNQTDEQLELTKKAFESILSQDIGNLYILAVNNGSTEPTRAWLDSVPFSGQGWQLEKRHIPQNCTPSRLANSIIPGLFTRAPYYLGVPNDAILPPNAYRLMLQWPRGYVCASDAGRNHLPSPEECHAVSESTPFAVALVRKWAYDAIVSGFSQYFDENYVHYASDCDMALKMAACGIRGVQLDIPFWHYGSGSWRMLSPEEGKKMTDQADLDRAYFQRKWGFRVNDPEYGQLTQDPNFRGSRQ